MHRHLLVPSSAYHGRERRLTVVRSSVAVSMVDDGCGAAVNGLESTSELAIEEVPGRVEYGSVVADGQVLEQRVVRVDTLALRLPQVMVRVNIAWTDNLARDVDNVGVSCRGLNVACDPRDERALDEDVGDSGHHMMAVVVEQESASLEQDGGLVGHDVLY